MSPSTNFKRRSRKTEKVLRVYFERAGSDMSKTISIPLAEQNKKSKPPFQPTSAQKRWCGRADKIDGSALSPMARKSIAPRSRRVV